MAIMWNLQVLQEQAICDGHLSSLSCCPLTKKEKKKEKKRESERLHEPCLVATSTESTSLP